MDGEGPDNSNVVFASGCRVCPSTMRPAIEPSPGCVGAVAGATSKARRASAVD